MKSLLYKSIIIVLAFLILRFVSIKYLPVVEPQVSHKIKISHYIGYDSRLEADIPSNWNVTYDDHNDECLPAEPYNCYGFELEEQSTGSVIRVKFGNYHILTCEGVYTSSEITMLGIALPVDYYESCNLYGKRLLYPGFQIKSPPPSGLNKRMSFLFLNKANNMDDRDFLYQQAVSIVESLRDPIRNPVE